MIGLARWCIAHRRSVVAGWILIAVLSTVVAGVVGRNYATNFSLPGTEAQRVLNLLDSEFPSQSGDLDTIVWRSANRPVTDPAVRAPIEALLAKVTLPAIAPSLGGVETLLTRPAATSHAGLSPEERARIGIGEGLLRMSVGIEATEELIEDLQQALA